MHSSASSRPAASPPGTATPASSTRAPQPSVCTPRRSSSVRPAASSASAHARSFIRKCAVVVSVVVIALRHKGILGAFPADTACAPRSAVSRGTRPASDRKTSFAGIAPALPPSAELRATAPGGCRCSAAGRPRSRRGRTGATSGEVRCYLTVIGTVATWCSHSSRSSPCPCPLSASVYFNVSTRAGGLLIVIFTRPRSCFGS